MAFDLNKYEFSCYHHEYEDAARQLVSLLKDLDSNLGQLTNKFTANVPSLAVNELLTEHFLSRIISATTFLFLQKDFKIGDYGISQMIYLQRWLEIIFAASPFRNADHILQGLNKSNEPGNPVIGTDELSKFVMFFLPDSNVPLNFESLWDADKKLAIKLAFALLSPRFLATESAHEKREMLLKWVPNKLKEIDSLDFLPVNILHDVYMHCSYADYEGRHNIKKELNRIIRSDLYKAGITDLPQIQKSLPEQGKKPIMLVVLEWFNEGHSIYRTHSRTIEEAKEKFYIIGVGTEGKVGQKCLHVFDEYHTISEKISLFDQVLFIRGLAEKHNIHLLYMPSIGMFLNTIFISCLRLAPVQMVALGHPATTNSPQIDYVVVEDIYVGKNTPKCFSEELLRLPEDVFYRPSAYANNLILDKKENDEVVHIAMAATIMKFNPKLLNTLQEILNKSKVKVHIHFLIGQAIGLTYIHVKNAITRILGTNNVTVHQHQGYDTYMKTISKCDLFLNPFPFGNTNGIVDTITAGLIGVCKTGPEVYEHIDEGLFKYLGLPDWLICETHQEYVDAALKLIHDKNLREELSLKYSGADKVTKLFGGDASCMGKMMHDRLVKKFKSN